MKKSAISPHFRYCRHAQNAFVEGHRQPNIISRCAGASSNMSAKTIEVRPHADSPHRTVLNAIRPWRFALLFSLKIG
jgi:hypothetical protein